MIATHSGASAKKKISLSDVRKINNGFLRHEGLELPENQLKHVLAHSRGKITDQELEQRICGLSEVGQ